MKSVNPANGELIAEFAPHTKDEVERRLQLAADCYREYRRTSFEQRAQWLARAAEILVSDKERLGRIMTAEMGKTLASAIQESEKSAWGCRYYAENAAALLADEAVETNASRSFVRYLPIGPVLAVMPWNFPFWQVFRFAAPALMAGNVGLLKHASNVPQCALEIERIFCRAGFPDGAFQTLLIGGAEVAAVIADPRVAAVTLTGSEAAGVSVAAAAGHSIKKTVLELGGSDPFVVMVSADLDNAVTTAVRARTINNGQSCIAAKRFIVHEAIYDEFERRFVAAVQKLKVGDPMDASTDVGPLATAQIRDDLADQVQRAVGAGARVLTGGRVIDGPGYFYEPSVLTNVSRESPVYHEEVFGPVAMLFRVPSLHDAIALANDTPFGLGASAWTNDEAERERFINDLESGLVFINGMVASDPRLPFGGVKHSGYGRELSEFGIREFVNIKTVWINDGNARANRTRAE